MDANALQPQAFPQGQNDKPGITKRQYMATHILSGIMAKEGLRIATDEAIEMAVELTDKLLKRLHIKSTD